MKQYEADEGTVFHIFKTTYIKPYILKSYILNTPFFESCAFLENKIDYFYDKNYI